MDNNAVNNVAVDLQNGTAAAPATEPQTLADVIGVSEQPAEQQPQSQATQPAAAQLQEPGWFQGRMQKERAKWEADHQAQMTQMTERQNALLERVIANDAQKLVDSGEFKSLEIATEYLRMKEGLPVNQTPQKTPSAQPRDDQGRFMAQQPVQNQAVYQRAETLVAQADTILGTTGVDVMKIFNTDPAVKQKVVSGEWDFTDVFKNAGGSQQAVVKPHVPAPVRSSNGVGLGNVSIGKMSNQQFAALNDFLAKNGKVNMS